MSAYQREWLLDNDPPPPTGVDLWWSISDADADPDRQACVDRTGIELWREYRDELLAEFISTRPGRRPPIWWRADAPRQPIGTWPGWFIDGKIEQPRERLGGVGTVAWDVLAHRPEYHCGIPRHWVRPRDVEYYTGQARDIHGALISPKYIGSGFAGVAIDPRDPPVYESQATYLKRLGLLLPTEARRLRPADFEPEPVMPEPEDDPPPLPRAA
ncbi:MAG: hypothetical protein WAS21_20480 [Geminicoccaceae bacterium]